MMKTKYYILCLSLFLSIAVNSQNSVNVVFNETELNNAIKVIKDARGVNFGDYLGQYGLNAWFLNLDEVQVDIQPNNKVVLNNVKLTGSADLDLWVFNWKPSGEIYCTIVGEFKIGFSISGGYYLQIVPTATSFVYKGPLQSIVNLVAVLTNNFKAFIPNIEVNLGTSLFPNLTLKYFTGIPQITTNNSEVILAFEVLFENLNVKNKIIKSGENVHYRARNSITLGEGFKVESGAIFSASIVPKNRDNLASITLNDEKSLNILNIGDSLISDKELTLIDVFQPNDFIKDSFKYVDVFPNPFINTLTIKSSDESSGRS